MSLFGKRQETRAMAVPDGWSELSGSSSSDAIGLVPFYASIRHIVDYLSTLPLAAYRKDGETRAPAPMPRLLSRLNDPGDIGMGNWVGQWAYGLAVHGNAVGWITEFDGYGYPLGIRWLKRTDWSYNDTGKQWYVFGQPVPSERIVHTPWIVPTGATLGLSPVEHFQAFFRAGMAAQEYADVSRGGGTPPAILKNTRLTLDAEQAAAVRDRAV
jgi:hypothetical protein